MTDQDTRITLLTTITRAGGAGDLARSMLDRMEHYDATTAELVRLGLWALDLAGVRFATPAARDFIETLEVQTGVDVGNYLKVEAASIPVEVQGSHPDRHEAADAWRCILAHGDERPERARFELRVGSQVSYWEAVQTQTRTHAREAVWHVRPWGR